MPAHQLRNRTQQERQVADTSMSSSRPHKQDGGVVESPTTPQGGEEKDSSASLPRTHDVLCEHVHAIVSSLVKPDEDAERITRLVAMGTEKELLKLLTDSSLMQERVERARALIEQGATGALSPHEVAKRLSPHQELVGKVLFEKVAEIESELSAQITGMLLELPLPELERLLESPEDLQAAVIKARIEYLAERHPDMLPSPEQLGQEIYEAVMQEYPEEAAKIAGMILELNPTKLHQLLECRDELNARIRQAHQTLSEHR